jgi:hypothetical protein
MKAPYLTKSRYIDGLRCEKKLWLGWHQRLRAPQRPSTSAARSNHHFMRHSKKPSMPTPPRESPGCCKIAGCRAFNSQIEQIKSPDGQTLGYGEIRSVHLDAGKRGKFEVVGRSFLIR